MTTRHTTALAGVFCLTILSCTHSAPPVQPATREPLMRPGHELLQGVLWTQSSVEYRAAARGTLGDGAGA